ncbi:MAG: 50S ribosomal protein L25 [Candidatus Kapabacteria bacterium]|nr:50S ribosomal protein L25 [Candidatus Kapabacteria bacterium]
MNEVKLVAFKRESGKKSAKSTRASGLVPGIYYFKGDEAISISVKPLDLRDIVYTAHSKLVNLQIEGDTETRNCVLKDKFFDPVTDQLMHFDLMGLPLDKKVQMEIPVNLKGQSAGVRLGGMMMQNIRKVHVKCYPKDLPDSLEVEVSKMNMGDSIHFRDISIPGVEFEVNPETVIAHVTQPRVVAKVEEAAPSKKK